MADIIPWLHALKFKEIQKDKLFELIINKNKIEVNIEQEKINYPNLNKLGEILQ